MKLGLVGPVQEKIKLPSTSVILCEPLEIEKSNKIEVSCQIK